jgi:hypothetical protein
MDRQLLRAAPANRRRHPSSHVRRQTCRCPACHACRFPSWPSPMSSQVCRDGWLSGLLNHGLKLIFYTEVSEVIDSQRVAVLKMA